MANEDHLRRLRQGVQVWNEWKTHNLKIKADLSGADLYEAHLRGVMLNGANLNKAVLSGAILSHADLHNANLCSADLRAAYMNSTDLRDAELRGTELNSADLRDANLHNANLLGADLSMAMLFGVNLSGANLRDANLRGANLSNANLRGADLRGAELSEANLSRADLRDSDLRDANLSEAMLVSTDFTKANLSGCRIYGISAWNVKLDGAIQTNLDISDTDSALTVDNLEVAQFIYMLIHNEKLRDIIDTITSKSVLILGRFTPERKKVLDAIRTELRKHNYTPILFDFEQPSSRDLTETVFTLAGMSRFVVADLSDPNSIPHELMSFAEKLLSVPVQAIFCPVPEHKNEYPMFKDHFWRYPHVLPIYRYESQEKLIDALYEKVIKPAEDRVKEMKPRD